MAWRAEVHHENILVLAGRLAGQSNRHFIKAALEVAVATLAGEYELEDADRSVPSGSWLELGVARSPGT